MTPAGQVVSGTAGLGPVERHSLSSTLIPVWGLTQSTVPYVFPLGVPQATPSCDGQGGAAVTFHSAHAGVPAQYLAGGAGTVVPHAELATIVEPCLHIC